MWLSAATEMLRLLRVINHIHSCPYFLVPFSKL
uniref:PHD finger protein ALFIN-LIKE 4 isoform X2 n=1 Tax=Rhizophora mucronata TaxID=61149 RepID=A0A2P2JAZ2_RHIMU